jgi:hypothetical protein
MFDEIRSVVKKFTIIYALLDWFINSHALLKASLVSSLSVGKAK